MHFASNELRKENEKSKDVRATQADRVYESVAVTLLHAQCMTERQTMENEGKKLNTELIRRFLFVTHKSGFMVDREVDVALSLIKL